MSCPIATLENIESSLRALSTDMWICTVDDPETATIKSEAEGMTPDRLILHQFMERVQNIADSMEALRLNLEQ